MNLKINQYSAHIRLAMGDIHPVRYFVTGKVRFFFRTYFTLCTTQPPFCESITEQ